MATLDADRLLLVRHAMPTVDPATPAAQWRLSPDGRAAARDLRPLITTPAHFVASPEPKALETLHEIAAAAAVTTDPATAAVATHPQTAGSSPITDNPHTAASAAVGADPGFAEVRRPSAWTDRRDYRAAARAYLRSADHDSWEPCAEVVARFDRAVVHHAAVATAMGSTLVIGTHGLALTLWLASRFALVPDPAGFWAALQFPDLIEVVPATGTVTCRRR